MASENGSGRLQRHIIEGTNKMPDDVSSSRLLLLRTRRLQMAKSRQQLSSTVNTHHQQQHPNTLRVQKKTLDGFLQKTRPKLTISTTDTSCTSSLSQIPPANNSVECQIPRMPSQHHSMEASVADYSFASSTAHDVATLYKEWRSLYGLSSTGNSETMYEDNKGEEDNAKEEVPSDEKSENHPGVENQKESQTVGQKAIDSPSDLLSAQYTTESSTDTMKTMILPNHRIQTPLATTSASCSFNSHFFQFLKSAVQKKFMSQMPGENNGNRVNDGKSADYNYIGDNSSRSYKSYSSEERYDEGEIKPTMDWTFESSESGSGDSEFS